MAGDLAAIVQHDDDLVPQQLLVDGRNAALQAARQAQLQPHAQEDGGRVQEQPADAQTEQGDAVQAGEQQSHQHGEGEDDPAAEDALVADVVQREAIVVDQRFHCVHVLFDGEL